MAKYEIVELHDKVHPINPRFEVRDERGREVARFYYPCAVYFKSVEQWRAAVDESRREADGWIAAH